MKFKIYQVKEEKTRTYGFMRMELLKRMADIDEDVGHYVSEDRKGVTVINMEHYMEAYRSTGKRIGVPSYTKAPDMLEFIFHKFNVNHPEDYRGRSVSVGDIVQVANRFYYCDSIGWKQIKVTNVPKGVLLHD